MQRLHGLLSGILLKEPDDNIKQNHSTYNTAFNPGLDPETDGHGHDQHLSQNWIRFWEFLLVWGRIKENGSLN